MAKSKITNVEKVANWFEIWIKYHNEEFNVYDYCKTYDSKVEAYLIDFGIDGWYNVLNVCDVRTFKLGEMIDMSPKFVRFFDSVVGELVDREIKSRR